VGRKQDINTGAGAACLVAAAVVGFATQSVWAGALAFIVLAGILSAMRIIR
jgi:hypothetical protein